MKVLAVLLTIFSGIALMNSAPNVISTTAKDKAVAINFGIYRNAVNSYATESSVLAPGQIAESLLDLPSGWKAIRSWANRLDGGNIYVWGSTSSGEAEQIRKLFMDSYAVGIKRDGILLNGHGTGIALPGFIPEGSIVSVITP